MNFVILGKPGAGKGSLSELFIKNDDVFHVSTGDIFRHEIESKSELGILADSYISKGQLCPDEVTNKIIENLIEKDPKRSYLFDGYPRTVNQAIALKEMFKKLNIKLDGVLDLVVDDEIVIERLSSRRVCSNCGQIYNTRNHMPKVGMICDNCGSMVVTRKDDNIDAIKKRLSVYENQTKPLVDYYENEGLIIKVDGCLDPILLYTEIKTNLNSNKTLSSQNL